MATAHELLDPTLDPVDDVDAVPTADLAAASERGVSFDACRGCDVAALACVPCSAHGALPPWSTRSHRATPVPVEQLSLLPE